MCRYESFFLQTVKGVCDTHILCLREIVLQQLDAEGASSSTKDEIIRGLNEDLAKIYTEAIIQYVVFSSTLKGAEYGDIAEQC